VSLLESVSVVLLVHAHPDDETISTGGLIRELVTRGIRTALLTATRGERGEIVPAMRERIDPGMLPIVRKAELRRAIEVLGIADAYLLGTAPARAAGLPDRSYADSGMAWVTPTLAGPADDVAGDALTAAPQSEVVADTAALLKHVRPDLVIGYDDLGGYGHPDHRAIREAAVRACAAAGIPFAELVPVETPGAERIRAAHHLDTVRRALRAHATQLTVDGDEIVHSGGQRERITTDVGLRVVTA
jgi:Uncharacterized proteins, LmbE homologs